MPATDLLMTAVPHATHAVNRSSASSHARSVTDTSHGVHVTFAQTGCALAMETAFAMSARMA